MKNGPLCIQGGFMEEKLKYGIENNPLEKSTVYRVKDKTFIVEPVFPKDGKETLGTVLLRLMQQDVEKP